jgi:Amt family ammonium transporter
MFQMTFAVITPALIIGAYVERIRFAAVLVISGLWMLLVYSPVAHWVWGGGWLAKMGVMDFAGGIVVHVTAGVSALVIAWMIAPRHEFPHGIRPPHAPWMVMVGASLLWVGWFGFNAGSAVASNADAGMAMLATHLSAASATMTGWRSNGSSSASPAWSARSPAQSRAWPPLRPPAGVAGPLAAVLLGAAASCVCYTGGVGGEEADEKSTMRWTCWRVHGVGGAMGTCLLAVSDPDGTGGGHLNHAVGSTVSRPRPLPYSRSRCFPPWPTFCRSPSSPICWLGCAWMPSTRPQGLDFATHGETGYHTSR